MYLPFACAGKVELYCKMSDPACNLLAYLLKSYHIYSVDSTIKTVERIG